MASKLQKIVAQRRLDVEEAKRATDVAALQAQASAVEAELGPPLSLWDAIATHRAASAELFVAAEFKRASPSKGDIAVGVRVGEQAAAYARAGAGLVSVLTEPTWFKGSLEDLRDARRAVNGLERAHAAARPLVLRKDFVVDEFQLYEARAFGADSVLLMLSVLSEEETAALVHKSRELGMEPLVEVVTEEEMKAALRAGAKVIGVNNRNLHTFEVDMSTTPRMAKVAAAEGVADKVALLALSGIKARADVRAYEASGGIAGLLIGETLMRARDPSAMISSLVRDSECSEACVRVKVCGINSAEAALVAAKAGADMIGVIFVSKSVRSVDVEGAKAIVQAIRAFREKTDGPISVEAAPAPAAAGAAGGGASSAPWFQSWARGLDAACDGQGRPLVVGVFMDQPVDEVNRIATETGIDLIQLHGAESKDYEAQCVLPTVRVVHVDAGAKLGPADDALPVAPDALLAGPASLLLLDTSVRGGPSGGTGKTFDWAIAAKARSQHGLPVVMAGGLTPDNVAEAVRAGTPWGVDVASGVESSPGVKDHDKIRAFIANAKSI